MGSLFYKISVKIKNISKNFIEEMTPHSNLGPNLKNSFIQNNKLFKEISNLIP